MQLVKTLVFPHFDYAAFIYIDVDLTRTIDLHIAHNACVHFVISSIPFMPTREVTSHVTRWRLRLDWLSLANRRHLQLIALFYDIQCRKNPELLFAKIKVPENLPGQYSDRHQPSLSIRYIEHTHGMPASQSRASD